MAGAVFFLILRRLFVFLAFVMDDGLEMVMVEVVEEEECREMDVGKLNVAIACHLSRLFLTGIPWNYCLLLFLFPLLLGISGHFNDHCLFVTLALL